MAEIAVSEDDVQADDEVVVEFTPDEEAALLVALLRWRGPDL